MYAYGVNKGVFLSVINENNIVNKCVSKTHISPYAQL